MLQRRTSPSEAQGSNPYGDATRFFLTKLEALTLSGGILAAGARLEGTLGSTTTFAFAKPEFAGHCAQGVMERESSVGETYRNVLTYAMAIVGDERLLAERLGVNPQQVLNWANVGG